MFHPSNLHVEVVQLQSWKYWRPLNHALHQVIQDLTLVLRIRRWIMFQFSTFISKSKAEDVQMIMYNKSALAVKAPIKLKVRPLIQLTKALKIGTQVVHVDPAVLLKRLLVLVSRAEKPDQSVLN